MVYYLVWTECLVDSDSQDFEEMDTENPFERSSLKHKTCYNKVMLVGASSRFSTKNIEKIWLRAFI